MHSGGRNIKHYTDYDYDYDYEGWKPGEQCTLHDTETLKRVAEGIPDDISIYSCGANFTLFYSKPKGWFACGSFKHNVFDEEPNELTPIPSLAKIVPLCFACGSQCYAIVSTDGKLFIRGKTFGPKLSEIELPAPAKFVACFGWSCIVLLDSGEIVYWGENPDKRKIVAGKRFVDCACGTTHFVALTDSGNVWTWAILKYERSFYSHERRECGRGVIENDEIGKVELHVKIKRVFATYFQTFLLDEKNRIWATGQNYNGQLGLGDRKERSEFTRVPEFTTERIIQIEPARFNMYVVTESGKVFVTGSFCSHMTLTEGEGGPIINDFQEEGDFVDKSLYSFTLAESTEGLNVTSISAGCNHLWLSTYASPMPNTVIDPILSASTEENKESGPDE